MRWSSGFFLFVLIGGLSSVVNLVARILINRTASYEVAIVLAFPIALITAFLLNRALVFRSSGRAWGGEFLRFLLVNLAALVQVFVVSVVLARLIFPAIGFQSHSDTIAHGIGLLSPILTSYWAHKHFSFRAGATAPTPLRARR